jgi:hypothetical protein
MRIAARSAHGSTSRGGAAAAVDSMNTAGHHRRTTVSLFLRVKSPQSVARTPLPVAAGALEPHCTTEYMRIAARSAHGSTSRGGARCGSRGVRQTSEPQAYPKVRRGFATEPNAADAVPGAAAEVDSMNTAGHHRRTPVSLFLRGKSPQSVARTPLPVAAGAQEPQCTNKYMRIPSTAGRYDQSVGLITRKIVVVGPEPRAGGGRRSAGTAVYKQVHEDREHRRTPPARGSGLSTTIFRG